jgi:DNA-binding transcriptional regulator YdaS (Cro superfamily)
MDLTTYLATRSNKEVALAFGVSQVIISQWKTGARRVPADRCPAIERATNGAVRCEDLRPDVDWAYLRATDCDVAKVGVGDTAADTSREAA